MTKNSKAKGAKKQEEPASGSASPGPPVRFSDEIDLLVGRRIRALRKARGWTLHDLASRLEMSYVYLSELERGEKPWKIKRLAQAAAIFELPPSLLQEPSFPLERLTTLARLLETLSVIPEEQFAAVAQLLASIHP